MSHDHLTGPHGEAHRTPRTNYEAAAPATLASWIITAPGFHPLWDQYHLAVITLADLPGIPPAKKSRPGVTHELMVMALDPDQGTVHAAKVGAASLQYLRPGNIAEQFTATDDQARELAELAAQAVVDGRLNPETAEAPGLIRATWSHAIQDTIAHYRDPHHGQAN